jgi:hypothetical protein
MLFIYIDKMATAGSKRSRKPNIKQEKLAVLVDEVEKKQNSYTRKVFLHCRKVI